MTEMRTFHNFKVQGGSSLIEVLISLALVAVTMLGLLGLQLRTLGLQKDSFDRRNAAVIAADFGERVAANFAGFREDVAYKGRAFSPGGAAPTAPACGADGVCTPAQIAERDWAALVQTVTNRLPGGAAFVDTPAELDRVDIAIGWLDAQKTADLTAGTLGTDPPADPSCPAGITDVRYRCYVATVYP